MGPTVGQIVYYKSRGSADGKFPPKNRAAIITDVTLMQDRETGSVCDHVRLCVLNPEGMFFTDWLLQGDKPGDWDYMEQTNASGELDQCIGQKSQLEQPRDRLNNPKVAYILVTASTVLELNKTVNNLISEGYVPSGGVTVDDTTIHKYYYQAMCLLSIYQN